MRSTSTAAPFKVSCDALVMIISYHVRCRIKFVLRFTLYGIRSLSKSIIVSVLALFKRWTIFIASFSRSNWCNRESFSVRSCVLYARTKRDQNKMAALSTAQLPNRPQALHKTALTPSGKPTHASTPKHGVHSLVKAVLCKEQPFAWKRSAGRKLSIFGTPLATKVRVGSHLF